eukprot:1026296-Pelagomonas_calceolata.AAC.1
MDNCIQKWLLRFLRFMLDVRTSTPSWSILRECGIESVQLVQSLCTLISFSHPLQQRSTSQ